MCNVLLHVSAFDLRVWKLTSRRFSSRFSSVYCLVFVDGIGWCMKTWIRYYFAIPCLLIYFTFSEWRGVTLWERSVFMCFVWVGFLLYPTHFSFHSFLLDLVVVLSIAVLGVFSFVLTTVDVGGGVSRKVGGRGGFGRIGNLVFGFFLSLSSLTALSFARPLFPFRFLWMVGFLYSSCVCCSTTNSLFLSCLFGVMLRSRGVYTVRCGLFRGFGI